MQAERGHRKNLHSPMFREIGVGVILGRNGSAGPQVVTQDLGRQAANPTFATGVAYYDLDGDAFYDLDEGIPGLHVAVEGASFSCTTALGGGWVVPIPTQAATRTVTFSGLGLNESLTSQVAQATNAKADLKLAYLPPTITSPAVGDAGFPYALTFKPLGARPPIFGTAGPSAPTPARTARAPPASPPRQLPDTPF